jgi:N-methylhydantoinase A
MSRIAFDVGGTFIDFVLQHDDGQVVTEKLLADPKDFVASVEKGLSALLERGGVAAGDVAGVIHATTLGSNAVLERRGPKVALLTTEGFRDVIYIQRSLRHNMYDVQIEKVRPLIPRRWIREVRERSLADGSVLRALDEDQVATLARELAADGFETVAISYLHAYARPAHERRSRDIFADVAPELLVTISSDVSLRGREYERTNTALVNAYLMPVFATYLDALERSLPSVGIQAPQWVMQSSGGLASAERVRALPVRTIESGPTASVLTATHHASLAGHQNVISFDMGGTTAKAAVVLDGRPATTHEFEVGREQMRRGSGLPVDTPAIDLVEIGTGGGSIAHARPGVLAVGPESAGAAPGPACYARGGREPTVTDANLLLGYLNPDYFAGGAMTLDREAAEAAVDRLAEQLGLDRLRTAWGIHQVATFDMERALRLVSVDRGFDPREFAMVCLGGAAAAHGSRLAGALGVRLCIVPPGAGVGSAIGLLQADESLEFTRTARTALDESTNGQPQRIFDDLHGEATAVLGDAWAQSDSSVHRTVGMRFVGQGHELQVPVRGESADSSVLVEAFHGMYERTYGYREDLPVEAVTWSLTLLRPRDGLGRPGASGGAAGEEDSPLKGEREAYFPEEGMVRVPVYDRRALEPETQLEGPCLIEEAHTTTLVLPGDELRVDGQTGALHIATGANDDS